MPKLAFDLFSHQSTDTDPDDLQRQAREFRRQVRGIRREFEELNIRAWTSPLFQLAYQSEEWKRLRAFIVDRSNGYCWVCTKHFDDPDRELTAHHTAYTHGVICPAYMLKPACWACNRTLWEGWWGFPQSSLSEPARPPRPANDNGEIPRDPAWPKTGFMPGVG